MPSRARGGFSSLNLPVLNSVRHRYQPNENRRLGDPATGFMAINNCFTSENLSMPDRKGNFNNVTSWDCSMCASHKSDAAFSSWLSPSWLLSPIIQSDVTANYGNQVDRCNSGRWYQLASGNGQSRMTNAGSGAAGSNKEVKSNMAWMCA